MSGYEILCFKSEFDKVEIAERETTRYGNVKNYLIFVGKI